jgi:hypothetical protein
MNIAMTKDDIKKLAVSLCITVSIVLILAIMIVGCNTKSASLKVEPYSNLTGEAIAIACTDPSAVYPITRMGFPMEAMVVRHEKCLGINDMLMVIWPGALNETSLTGAKLLLLMFLDYQNLSNPEKNLTASHVKNLVLDEGKSHMAIYALKTSLPNTK